MSGFTKKRRKYAQQPCCSRLCSFSFSFSSPAAPSFSATMSPCSSPDTAVSPHVALDDLQHRTGRAYSSVAATALQLRPWRSAVEMLLLCSVAMTSPILWGSCQTTIQSHASHDRRSSNGSITDATGSVSISNINSNRSRSIISSFDNTEYRSRSKYRSTAGRPTLSPDRIDTPTAARSSSNLETTPEMRNNAPLNHIQAAYDTERNAEASKMARGEPWMKLHSISNHTEQYHSFPQLRDKELAVAVAADFTVSERSRAATADTDSSVPSFTGTAAAATTSQPPRVPSPPVAAVSAPVPVFSPAAPGPRVPAAASQATSPATVPLSGQSPAAPETSPAAAPTIATPAAVTGWTGAVPASLTPVAVTAPGAVAVSVVPTATPSLTPEVVVAPQPALPAQLGDNVPLSVSARAAPAATGGNALPTAAVPTGAWGGGSTPLSGVVSGQPPMAVAPSPAEVPLTPTVESGAATPTVVIPEEKMLRSAIGALPLLPTPRGRGATGGAVGGSLPDQGPVQERQPVLQTELPQQHQPQPQGGQIQREVQHPVQKHGVQQQQLQRIGEEPAVKTATQASSAPVYERGIRVTPAAHPYTPRSGGGNRRVCFDACECWPVWASSIAALVLYSAATLVAVLMTAGLFSKGLRSSSFYKGGGYWLLGASAAGTATGALIGGLVARCVGAALGLAAGMMCLSASLVLLGSRGAWLGALGGVMTGGVIGAMTNGGAAPIGLGAGIGLLLGVICGFVPLARHLKMNERYIRRGMTQGAAAVSASPSRMATRRGISRSHTGRSTKEQYGRSLEAGGSSSEDVRSLAVQRLSSNPVGRFRSGVGLPAVGAVSSSRNRSVESDFGPPPSGTLRKADTRSTAQFDDPAHAVRSIATSAGEPSHAA